MDSPFGHLGHYKDVETGLAYVRHRYFDPALACWLSPDPIGIEGGTNLLGYNGPPTSTVDPLGLADHGDLGTYNDLNKPGHAGDNMDADEVLLHSYLAERQKDMRAEHQRTFDPDRRGAGGADSASGGNPCIALETNKMDWGHPPGPYGNGTHSRVAELERAAGLYSDKLRTMTAVEVIDKKIGILRQALTESGEFTPAEINAKLAALRQQAIDHAKTIFKPCSLAARGLFP